MLAQFGLGLLGGIVIVVVLVLPVIAMLLLPPGGIPTRLPDLLALALLGVAGIVAGFLSRWASRRLACAVTMAVLLGVLAFWFNANTWWPAGWLPAPPLLPNVGPTLTVAAGLILAATWVAATHGPGDRGGATDPRAGADPGSGVLVLGIVAPLALLAVVELDVWGRGVIQRTFQGPWGLGRFTWLALLFLALLVASLLVGLVVAAPRDPLAPAVAAGVLLVGVVAVWVVAGGLGGPPRSHLYGLGLGALFLAAAAVGLGRRGSTVGGDR